MVKRSQVIVESLTGVKKVDLGVRPDPGTLLIGLIMPYGRAQDHDVLKAPPAGAFQQIQDENCFSTPRLSAYRRRMQEVAIFNIELCIHDDKKIDVQSAGRLCLLRDLDRNAFADIFYAATAAIIACSEVKPQGVLAGQEFSQIDVCQGQVFCDRSYVGVTLTARRKVLLCLVPHLIGAHPLTVEWVGDALDGDLHFRYLGVVKGLSVASEGLLRGDILEEHQDALHVAGGHV